MTDREMKIAEIRQGYKSDKNDNSFTYKKETVERDIQFLLSELERSDKERDKMIKGLQSLLIELDQKWEEAHQKWKTEADMYYQGAEYAFDFAQSNLRDILKEIGVNEDANPN